MIHRQCIPKAGEKPQEKKKRKNVRLAKSMFRNQLIILSKHYINYNLFVTHAVVAEILDIFYSKYNSLDLTEVSADINIPVTVKELKVKFNELLLSIEAIILEQWFHDVASVLDRHQITSNNKLQSPNDNFSSRKLFKCISALLSALMRLLILNALEQIKGVFEKYTVPGRMNRSLDYSIPFVIVEIDYDEKSKSFKIAPNMSIIYEEINGFLRSVIDITKKKTLSSAEAANKKSLFNLFQVSYDDTEVQKLTSGILNTIEMSIIDPETCLEPYELFKPILDGSFEGELKYYVSAESNFALKDFQPQIEKYLYFINLVTERSDKIHWNFLQIDCTLINKKIVNTINLFYTALCSHLTTKLRDNNSNICSIFDDVANKISETPESTREVVELYNYLNECKDTTMYYLKSKLLKSAELLLFIVQYLPLNQEDIALNTRTFTWPKEMEKILELGITRLNIRKEMLENGLKSKRSNCGTKIEQIKSQISDLKKKDLPLLTENEAKFFVSAIDSLSDLIDSVMDEANNINDEESLLDMELTTFSTLYNMNALVKSLHILWHTTYSFLVEYDKWFYSPVNTLDVDDIFAKVSNMEDVLKSLPKDITNISAVRRASEILRNKIDTFKKYIPLLQIVCNQSFRIRHWKQVGAIINQDLDSSVLNLSYIISCELNKYIDELVDISANATKEFELEQNLNRMYNDWTDKYFQLEFYRDTQITILCQVDDIQMLLDDHILKVQTLRSQPSVEAFLEEVITWEEKLILVQDIIDQWLTCQAAWINLEPIFNSDDIAWQMPQEAEEFKKVDVIWRSLMQNTKQNSRVLDITNIANVIDQFKLCNAMLHEINKCLDDYLDRKRSLFARFYFLTNKELSDLISISKNLSTVQSQLYKCFEGIQAVQVTRDEEIVGFVTTQNEYIPFSGRIYFAEMKGFIEKWLLQLEDNMKSSIRDICQDTISSYVNYDFQDWVMSWPGQAVICCYQIYWTRQVAEFIKTQNAEEMLEKQSQDLKVMLLLMNGHLEMKNFEKINTLIMLNLHGNDVYKILIERKIASLADFDWLSQTRHYWLSGNVTIANVTTSINYGFECIGSNSRLIITPMTDRCIKLIMSAMKLNLYTALEGTSGTGKTEILKDFAKTVAKQLIMINCCSGTQYKLINNIFKGIIQCGAWLCLDNMSEARMETLSTLTQHIQAIQIGIKSRTDKINFEGTDVKLNPSCFFCATMKPLTQFKPVPSNLRHLFRVVAMTVPDFEIIVEITLATYAFKHAKILSHKLLHVLQLLSSQMSAGRFVFNLYDVNAVLGRVKSYVKGKCGLSEDAVILTALNDVLLSKTAHNDYRLFDSACRLVFGDTTVDATEDQDLKQIIKMCLSENYSGLSANNWFLNKVMQLNDAIGRKPGIIIVGESMNGKTQLYKTLARALNYSPNKNVSLSECRKVQFKIINPTALSFEQLYGRYDEKTKEWIDGIFVKICRELVTRDNHEKKWIILDGVGDRYWMEYLNSIFEDTQKLFLTSGENIKMCDSTSIISELINLDNASPATICRCAVIYMDSNKTDWRDIYVSYKRVIECKLPVEQSDVVYQIIEWLTEPILRYLNSQSKSLIEINESHKFIMFMQIFKNLIMAEATISTLWLQCTLLFSLIWGLCSTLDNNSRKLFDVFFRNLLTGKNTQFPKPKIFNLSKSQLFPEKATVFEWIYDKENNGTWLLWTEVIPKKLGFTTKSNGEVIVSTMETCIMKAFMQMNIVENNVSLLFIGPSGSGKTSVALDFIKSLPISKYTSNYVTFNVLLKPRQVQKIMTNNLDRRRKEYYGPPMGKCCVMFIDDMNTNQSETNIKSLELLRQWIEHEYLIDFDALKLLYLIDIVLLGTMLPRDFKKRVNRFVRHTHVIGIDHFDNTTVNKIFTTILELHFAKLNAGEMCNTIKDIVIATVNVFEKALCKFMPTPRSEHYVFHLNDIHRVIKGLKLLSLRQDEENNKESFIELWIHEMCRNFSDRLVDENDCEQFYETLKSSGIAYVTRFENTWNNLVKAPGEISSSMFDLVYIPVLNINGSIKLYDKEENLIEWRNKLEKLLIQYKQESGLKLDYVFFSSAIRHLSRLLRVLLFENEHMMLIGSLGSGKNVNAKLASIVARYSMHEITNMTLDYDEWRSKIKNTLSRIGITNSNVLFRIRETDVRDESYLHDIYSLLSTGDVLHIFTAEERTDIVKKMIDQLDTERNQVLSNTTDILNMFCDRIRSNLRIIFIVSINKLMPKPSMFWSLMKYCVIDWYSSWPKESLQDIAKHVLSTIDLDSELVDKFKQVCEYFHSSMLELNLENELNIAIKDSISSVNFLHFLECFKTLYQQKLNAVLNHKSQYDVGLAKLNQVANQVGIMQTELRDLQPKLLVKSQLSDKLMIKIEQDTINVEARKEVVAADEALANEAAAAAQAIKDDCEGDLAEASPALETALTALDTLKHSDITIVKSMKNPPAGVRLVMEAVCVLKGVKPEKVQDTVTGKIVDDYWQASTKMLGDIKFLENLKTFDKDNILPANMKKIREKYMNDRSFQPEIIRKTSMACEGLCKWIRAMEVYDRVIKVVAPKKMMLSAAEAELAVQMETLNAKRALLQDVTDKLQQLNDEFAECLREKRDLENQIDICIQKLERAGKLLGGLNNERIRWNDITLKLENKCSSMVGDILVASAFITYLATLGGDLKKAVLNDWLQYCEDVGITFNREFNFHDIFMKKEEIKFWIMNGLPLDEYIVDNAIIARETNRYLLIIDPQWQANKWIKNSEKDNQLCVVSYNDEKYFEKIIKSVEFGAPVMVENVTKFDDQLKSLLRKNIYDSDGNVYIDVLGNRVKYNSNFRLYLTSPVIGSNIFCDIFIHITIINFAITPKGLTNHLLKLIMAEKAHSLHSSKEQATFEYINNNRTLQEIEYNILSILSSTEGNILDDENTLKTLSTSKSTAEEIRDKQMSIESTIKEIEKSEKNFISIAEHTACLFFAISRLSYIQHIYQFSIDWFCDIFVNCVKSAASLSTESDFEKLMFDLNSVYYQFTCRSLFVQDQLVLSFIMTTFLTRKSNQLNSEWLQFLLNNEETEARENSEKSIPWLPNENWKMVIKASSLQGFEHWDKLFLENISQWKRFYNSVDSLADSLPRPFGDEDDFKKIIIMKCLRPDKVIDGMKNYISNKIGSYLINPVLFNIFDIYNESSNISPILIICSPEMNPMNYIKTVAKKQGLHRKQLLLLSFDENHSTSVTNIIKKSIKYGEWVIIRDCHLFQKWMSHLDWLVENVITDEGTHSNFRLWLTSCPSDEIPVTLILKSTKVVINKKSQINQNNIIDFMSQLESNASSNSHNENIDWKRFVYSTYYLHLIINERLRYGRYGWNNKYTFDDNFLKLNLDFLTVLQKFYNYLPTKLNKYYIGECVYGSNVFDTNDRRLLNTLTRSHLESILMNRISNPYEERIDTLLSNIEDNTFSTCSSCEIHFTTLGFSENAYSAKQIREASLLLSTLFVAENKHNGSNKDIWKNKVLEEIVQEINSKIPLPFDVESIENGTTNKEYYMNSFLLHELKQFNVLISTIKFSLENMQNITDGRNCDDTKIISISEDILRNRVPKNWLQCSYPSAKKLGSYIKDLVARAQFYQIWIENDALNIVKVSHLYSVSSFVFAVLMSYSARNHTSPESLSIFYEITSVENTMEMPTSPGTYISDVFIDGARWNRITKALDEPLPKIIFDKVPLIRMKPDDTKRPIDNNVYRCPVYATPERSNPVLMNIHFNDADSCILFRSTQPESHWIYRGVACVCQTDE